MKSLYGRDYVKSMLGIAAKESRQKRLSFVAVSK